MSSMDQFLAEHYGTNKTASPAQEDLEKAASVELFLKLANEEGIDIKSMTDSQVQALYSNWATKAAEFPPKKEGEEPEEKEKEKVEEAKKEHEEKKAEAAKIAEADFLGRVMAHSYVQEMRKIAADSTVKTAGELPPALMAHMKGKDGKEPEKKEEEKEHEHEDKKASAIDQLAVRRAGEIVKSAGLDPEVATKKIAAAFTLNLIEGSTKVAAAADLATAVEVRALELLERVGYPVQWNQ
jgi:hypothetical protein